MGCQVAGPNAILNSYCTGRSGKQYFCRPRSTSRAFGVPLYASIRILFYSMQSTIRLSAAVSRLVDAASPLQYRIGNFDLLH